MPAVHNLNLFRRFSEPARPMAPARARRYRAARELAHEENLVRAAYSYRIVPLEGIDGEELLVSGVRLHAPHLIPGSGELTALAVGVCTLGEGLDRRVRELFDERQAVKALELDRLGNQLLFALNRSAQDRISGDVRKRGLTMSGELRSGDPGLDLETQGSVLWLAEADEIGVTLGFGAMMFPTRSTSFVLGVGVDLPPATWSRCDHCPSRERCGLVAGNA